MGGGGASREDKITPEKYSKNAHNSTVVTTHEHPSVPAKSSMYGAKNVQFGACKNADFCTTNGTKTKSRFRPTATLLLLWLFAFALVFCVVGNLNANKQNDTTNSVIALPGDGYYVSTATEFLSLCNDSTNWDKNIMMTNDIEITDFSTFKPIGGETPFSGTFDGQGHTLTLTNISNIAVLRVNSNDYGGVFGILSGTIQNLHIYYNCDSSVTAYINTDYDHNIYAGGFAGYMNDGSKINNCMLSGYLAMNLNAFDAGAYAGGFAGNGGGIISNCVMNATLSFVVSGMSESRSAAVSNWCTTYCIVVNGTKVKTLNCLESYSGEHYNSIYTNDINKGSGMENGNPTKGYYSTLGIPTELKNNKDAFINGTTNYTWNSSYPWDFDNVWTFVGGVNDGLPVLKLFYGLVVTFDATTNGGTTATASIEVDSGSINLGNYTASKNGWTFVGWNADKTARTGATSGTQTISENTTFYAIFKKDISVSFYDFASKTSVGSVKTQVGTMWNTDTTASVAAVTPTTISGLAFVGWTTNASNATSEWNGTSKAFSADATYYAISKYTITITYNANKGTSTKTTDIGDVYITAGKTSVSQTKKPTFTLPTTGVTRNGYIFKGWGTTANATTVVSSAQTLTENTTFYAVWEQNFTLLTISGTISSANSMLLLTIVDSSGNIVQEVAFVTGQTNLSAAVKLSKNATYKILVTKPFGSVLTVTGATKTSSTVYTLSTGANETLSATFILSGNGQWSNTVVI